MFGINPGESGADCRVACIQGLPLDGDGGSGCSGLVETGYYCGYSLVLDKVFLLGWITSVLCRSLVLDEVVLLGFVASVGRSSAITIHL